MDQNLCAGDVGQIIHNDQYIFYLIIREKYKRSFSINIFEKSLINLRSKMEILKLTKLAMPKNGFDCINPHDAVILISNIFAKSNIEITICLTISVSCYFISLFILFFKLVFTIIIIFKMIEIRCLSYISSKNKLYYKSIVGNGASN